MEKEIIEETPGSGWLVIFGMLIGAVITFALASAMMTSDEAIKSRTPFEIRGDKYVCFEKKWAQKHLRYVK